MTTTGVRTPIRYVWSASFPRYRYDQIMRLGWKVFIPITIAWVLADSVTQVDLALAADVAFHQNRPAPRPHS